MSFNEFLQSLAATELPVIGGQLRYWLFGVIGVVVGDIFWRERRRIDQMTPEERDKIEKEGEVW